MFGNVIIKVPSAGPNGGGEKEVNSQLDLVQDLVNVEHKIECVMQNIASRCIHRIFKKDYLGHLVTINNGVMRYKVLVDM